jgi:hypothetical protein
LVYGKVEWDDEPAPLRVETVLYDGFSIDDFSSFADTSDSC